MDWKELDAAFSSMRKRARALIAESEARVARWEYREPSGGGTTGALAWVPGGARLAAAPRRAHYAIGHGADGSVEIVRYHNPDLIVTQQHVNLKRKGGLLCVHFADPIKVVGVSWREATRQGETVAIERSVYGNGTCTDQTYAYRGRKLIGYTSSTRYPDGTHVIAEHRVDAAGKVAKTSEHRAGRAFDHEAFARELTKRVSDGFDKRPAGCRKETLYAVALYTSGQSGYGYIKLCCNTEEGLRRAARSPAHRDALRWSTPDWAYDDIAASLSASDRRSCSTSSAETCRRRSSRRACARSTARP